MKLKISDHEAREYFPYLNGEKLLNCVEVDTEAGTVILDHGGRFLDSKFEERYEEKSGIVQLLNVDLLPVVEKVRIELHKRFNHRRFDLRDTEADRLANTLLRALAIERVNHEFDIIDSDETLGEETALLLLKARYGLGTFEFKS